jgi:iron complex outermembrane receptor protein
MPRIQPNRPATPAAWRRLTARPASLLACREAALAVLAAGLGVPAAASADAAAAAPPAGQQAASAAAQAPASQTVEDVVVTARHRAEKAQKVPISLTSVGAAKLDATNITSLNALQFLVPTLQVTEFNPRNTSFNIRGVGNNVSVANDGLESGVGVYVDGVFYSRPAQAAFSFPDIDNVQVLRGPQGTLFGKNTTAGAVDVHSQLPSNTPQASLEASVGNYGFWQFKGRFSDGISDKVSASISFLLDQRNGTETSIPTGQHYGTLDDKAVRVQFLAMPTDDLTLRLIADYAHQLENCCVYFPTGVFTKLTNGTTIPYNILLREIFTGYNIPSFNAFGRDAAIDQPTYYNMETGGASLQADYLLGDFTLTSISAWRFWDWYPINGALDGIGLDVIHDSNQTDYQRQLTQELRVTSPTGGPVDYTAGGFFFYQDLPGALRTTYGADAGPFLVGPKLPAKLSDLIFNGLNVYGRTDPVTNSYASYGQATWHITPELDLIGGLRYTYEDKSGSYDQTQFGAAPLTGLPAALVKAFEKVRLGLGAPLYYNDHTHNGAVSYLASVTYKLTPDILAYASYARGNKSEGINVTNLPLGINPVVKPERIDNYELGIKTSWLNDKLVFNADAFWIEDSDYQGIAIAPIGSGVYTAYISSVPKVQSRGFEIDSHAKPFPWLTLNFAGAFTDAIYESYPHGQCPPEIAGAASEICNLTGKNVPGTSRWTMSTGGEITQSLGDIGRYGITGYLGADFSLRSSFNDLASDSIYSKVPGYGLLDLRLGARTDDGKYDAFLWSHNATNTNYYMVLGPATPLSGLLDGIPGDPLTFGFTLKARL